MSDEPKRPDFVTPTRRKKVVTFADLQTLNQRIEELEERLGTKRKRRTAQELEDAKKNGTGTNE